MTATLALFIALSGSAAALTQISGSAIRNRSIAGRKLIKQTVSGTEVNASTLGKVPAAANADHATNAGHAANADRATNADHATSADSATNATSATNADSAANASMLGGVAPQPAWQTLPLHAGCASAGSIYSPPGYMVDAFGFVHFRGFISCSTYQAFQLPAAVAPGYRKFFRLGTNDTSVNTELYIDSSGAAGLETSGISFSASLEGVTYRVGS